MLFAKRTAIIEKSFMLPKPIPLKVSLSVWNCVSSLLPLFSLLSSIILLSTCLFFSLSLSLSVASFYSRRLCHFLLSVLVFSCSFVSLSLPLTAAFFCHFLLVFLHTVINTRLHTHINKSSFCEVPEVRERI